MKYVYIGKIVNTHGIKGEVKILSDIDYKELVFKKNFKIYIGNKKEEEIINTYRKHKIFDMITLNGINDINDVLKYKGLNIYVNKEDIKDVITDEDYIGLDVYIDKYIGKVTDIRKGKFQDIIVVNNSILIPKVDAFIKKIDFSENKIYINEIEGLLNED